MHPRLWSDACDRNRAPILDALTQHLPAAARVFEVASGTGMHAAFFALHRPAWQWQPSDPQADARASVDAWAAHEQTSNLAPALPFDVRLDPWPAGPWDAVVCINMIHIAPWSACEALMQGAGAALSTGGLLVIYGPFYTADGMAPSNHAFDASLRGRNPEWGIRHIDAVTREAAKHGLRLHAIHAMPANNLTVVFERE
jgi:hypothetical protein